MLDFYNAVQYITTYTFQGNADKYGTKESYWRLKTGSCHDANIVVTGDRRLSSSVTTKLAFFLPSWLLSVVTGSSTNVSVGYVDRLT